MNNVGAHLTFTAFTDEFVAWQTRSDLQEFFEDIRIAAGTTDNYGTFKQCEATLFEPIELVNGDNFNIVVDGVSVGLAPKQESFDELKTAFIALQTSYNDLLEKLRTAKILDG